MMMIITISSVSIVIINIISIVIIISSSIIIIIIISSSSSIIIIIIIIIIRCGSHLGHVFYDSITDANPNGERHWANGLSLKYSEGEPEMQELSEANR